MVRAVNVKGHGNFTRSAIEELTEKALKLGAKGMAWIALKDDGEPYSILTKYFSQEEFQSLLDAVDGKPGDFILFCADQFSTVCRTLGGLRLELADMLGFTGQLKQNMLDSVARYNEACRRGRDEDFGKDPSLLVSLDTPPYYAMLTDRTKGGAMGPMVTVDGLWTDDRQQVYDQQLNPIPGLYATGNCCGRRFGVQYSTPVSGVSIGIAWTLGRELGKHLVSI